MNRLWLMRGQVLNAIFPATEKRGLRRWPSRPDENIEGIHQVPQAFRFGEHRTVIGKVPFDYPYYEVYRHGFKTIAALLR